MLPFHFTQNAAGERTQKSDRVEEIRNMNVTMKKRRSQKMGEKKR